MRTEHNKSLFSHYTKEAHAGSLTVTSFASNRTKQKRGKRTKQKTRNCTQKKGRKRTEQNKPGLFLPPPPPPLPTSNGRAWKRNDLASFCQTTKVRPWCPKNGPNFTKSAPSLRKNGRNFTPCLQIMTSAPPACHHHGWLVWVMPTLRPLNLPPFQP